MKVIQSASAGQNSPSQPANATSSSAHTTFRTGTYISGAFLFVAFVAGSVYTGASANDDTQPAAAQSSTPNASLRVEASQDSQAATPPVDTKASDTSGGKGVSTSVTTTNGVTEVKVNGQTVQPASDGSVHKSVTTDNGTVNVNVSQNNTGTGFGSSYVNYNSSSSSSSFSSSSEQSMNSGQ